MNKLKIDKKYILLGCMVIAVALWVLTGQLSNSHPDNDLSTKATVAGESAQEDSSGEESIVLVRGIRSKAEEQTVYLAVRSQTRANRIVQVKAEISGKIVALPGEKGTEVKQGDLLCRIAVDARQDEYNETQAAVASAQIEFDGFVDLNRKGLQSEVLLARARATLEQSKTGAKRAALALENTRLLAPFDGVVASQQVEVGDFLTSGTTCVSLMEIDPILVTGQVAEKNISQVALDDEVTIALLTGGEYRGRVSFIGHAPDMATRTFPIEVTLANPGMTIRAGLTAEMRVPVGVENVHLISPASLVLNDIGTIGIRVMDDNNRVRFMAAEIIGESPEGVLIKGLPGEINLITVGQGEVVEGQRVNMDYSSLTAFVHSKAP